MTRVVEAVNVGAPRAVEVNGHTIWTAIWKSPVEGRVPLHGVNMRGDARPTGPCTVLDWIGERAAAHRRR